MNITEAAGNMLRLTLNVNSEDGRILINGNLCKTPKIEFSIWIIWKIDIHVNFEVSVDRAAPVCCLFCPDSAPAALLCSSVAEDTISLEDTEQLLSGWGGSAIEGSAC